MSIEGLHLPRHGASSNITGEDCHDVRRRLGIPGTQQSPHHATRGRSPKRTIVPWEAFLPAKHDSRTNGRPDVYHHSLKNADFKELLNEGKKRLEKAGQEQQLRERAQVVGTMGGCELEDLLADLCEPSFSRRQNE